MAETDSPSREAELARKLNEEIAGAVARRRFWTGLLAACLVAVGVLLAAFGLHVFAFAAWGTAVAFGILCFDAHGHLGEVRGRSSRSLTPRLSTFFVKRKPGPQTQDAPQRPT